MYLREFFGKELTVDTDIEGEDEELIGAVYTYIINHDRLYKDYVVPLQPAFAASMRNGELPTDNLKQGLLKLVNMGCKEFYQEEKLTGKLQKLFPKGLRMKVVELLVEHYIDEFKGVTNDDTNPMEVKHEQ